MIPILIAAFVFWKSHQEVMAVVIHTYNWDRTKFEVWSAASAVSFSVLIMLIIKHLKNGM